VAEFVGTALRMLRTLALACCALLFVGVVISWIASYLRPHGVTVECYRRYAIVCDRGVIQLRRSTKTDIVQYGWNAWHVEEVGFAAPGAPATTRWRTPAPRLVFSPWRIYSEGEALMGGGYVPEPSTGRTIAMGELTRAVAIAHWPIALVFSLPLAWWSRGLRRRIVSSRRPLAGLCAGCGYDLRGTPDRCPECGQPTATTPSRAFRAVAACLFATIVLGAAPTPARAAAAAEDAPPTIPIGLDAYRQWDKWPLQRIGCRAYMYSTYDRAGGNEGADASHFLYQLADDQNVTLDLAGLGILYFARFNHWHGSPWHFTVDGVDHIIRESSTNDPLHPVENSTFDPPQPFPKPLAFTWSDTRGADLSWVPIEFQKSLRMAYARTHYGTGYYIVHRYVPGAKLSHPIGAWSPQMSPHADVVELLTRTNLAPDSLERSNGKVALAAGKSVEIATVSGPSCIRQLVLRIPKSVAVDLASARLRITWDGRGEPSIDAPIGLFFGGGNLFNRDDRKDLVKSFPLVVQQAGKSVSLVCFFPMPYFRSAKIELIGGERDIAEIQWYLAREPLKDPPNHVAYLHATYRDHPAPAKGKDLVLLDTRGIEGSETWTGSFIGTSFIFSHNANLTTLEGDPRFFFDDSQSPQAQGTGTEEWGGGGDYWGGLNMSLPFAGHPTGAKSAKEARSDEDKIESAYRFLLADLFPFGKNARIQLEHGGTNESTEHYETVTYWYGLPGASVIKTDQLDVGAAASEQSHNYDAPDASPPQLIVSRYEQDDADRTETGRTTTGSSQFTLKLDPDNWGVMLRRTLDYSLANQRAEVEVESSDGWKPAGVWYTAGSTTCVYSNPKDELGATQHQLRTSNHRLRDDEILIGRDLTRGRESIRVRVKFTPVTTPLFPGHPFPSPPAWSEIRYAAYCFVMPPNPSP
jgi:D-arabinan exo alpha-(1,3)/(1,5)-arabinofuranosidase (non-reducing end)